MIRRFLIFSVLLSIGSLARGADETGEGWMTIFDGETLSGWKASENEENWTVEDGAIVGRGGRSHLFYAEQEFADLEFEAEVMINRFGNSGMYFRAEFGPGWPNGYEAQVNNSHLDPKRTGSPYNFVDVRERMIPDDTWWKQSILADGNHIVIKVNDKVVVDYVDEKETHKQGFVALQQHHNGSVVRYKNLRVRPLKGE